MKKPRKPPHYYTFKQWKKIIKDCEKSELPEKVYCKKKKIAFETFSRWKKRVTSSIPVHFIEYKSRSLEEWKEIIVDWEKSGFSRRAYCVQNKLSQTTFSKWQKKIAPSSSQTSLDFMKKSEGSLKFSLEDFFGTPMEDSGISINSSSSQKIEVIFAQGHRLSIEGPLNWEDLRSWLTPLLIKQD